MQIKHTSRILSNFFENRVIFKQPETPVIQNEPVILFIKEKETKIEQQEITNRKLALKSKIPEITEKKFNIAEVQKTPFHVKTKQQISKLYEQYSQILKKEVPNLDLYKNTLFNKNTVFTDINSKYTPKQIYKFHKSANFKVGASIFTWDNNQKIITINNNVFKNISDKNFIWIATLLEEAWHIRFPDGASNIHDIQHKKGALQKYFLAEIKSSFFKNLLKKAFYGDKQGTPIDKAGFSYELKTSVDYVISKEVLPKLFYNLDPPTLSVINEATRYLKKYLISHTKTTNYTDAIFAIIDELKNQ